MTKNERKTYLFNMIQSYEEKLQSTFKFAKSRNTDWFNFYNWCERDREGISQVICYACLIGVITDEEEKELWKHCYDICDRFEKQYY